jgi:hypothetical protein
MAGIYISRMLLICGLYFLSRSLVAMVLMIGEESERQRGERF